MATFSEASGGLAGVDQDFGLRRLRRRFGIGAGGAAAGWVAALATDLVRNVPTDDMVIVEVEIACGTVFLLCALVSILAWIQASHTGHALSMFMAARAANAEIDRRGGEAAEDASD